MGVAGESRKYMVVPVKYYYQSNQGVRKLFKYELDWQSVADVVDQTLDRKYLDFFNALVGPPGPYKRTDSKREEEFAKNMVLRVVDPARSLFEAIGGNSDCKLEDEDFVNAMLSNLVFRNLETNSICVGHMLWNHSIDANVQEMKNSRVGKRITTFRNFYATKKLLMKHPNQAVLEVAYFPKSVLHHRVDDFGITLPFRNVFVASELVTPLPITGRQARFGKCLPNILSQFEMMMATEELREVLNLSPMIRSLDLLQAVTTFEFHYTRHAFLGHSFVALLCGSNLFCSEINDGEGVLRGYLKSHISDEALCVVAQQYKVPSYVQTSLGDPEEFVPPGCAPFAYGVNADEILMKFNGWQIQQVSDELLAEVMKAIIGVSFSVSLHDTTLFLKNLKLITKGFHECDSEYRNLSKPKDEYVIRFPTINWKDDPKSALMEYANREFRTQPRFEYTSYGSEHNKQFKATIILPVSLDDVRYGVGEGPSKRLAERKAAEKLCKELIGDLGQTDDEEKRSTALKNLESLLNYPFRSKEILSIVHPDNASSYDPKWNRFRFIGDLAWNWLTAFIVFHILPSNKGEDLSKVKSVFISDRNDLARHPEKVLAYLSADKLLGSDLIPNHLRERATELKKIGQDNLIEYFMQEEKNEETSQELNELADLLLAIAGAVFVDCGFSVDTFKLIFYPMLKRILEKASEIVNRVLVHPSMSQD
eukprot:TRINITY_DN3522_c0_g3_i1.p1 TRINITY_DN3522_c0_g3~~TRINITY_DN3522_c0_g3_i1.p1  ORF type:complete len:793 (-),score=200.66 TRINITY_DN3522_c0_g3_i1:208-2328(-)